MPFRAIDQPNVALILATWRHSHPLKLPYFLRGGVVANLLQHGFGEKLCDTTEPQMYMMHSISTAVVFVYF